MAPVISVILRDQLSLPIWLLVGAALQTVLLAFAPVKYLAAVTLGTLTFIATRTALQSLQWLRHTPSPPVIPGRYSARAPTSASAELSGDSTPPVVVFVLGFQSSHPLGRLAPGIKEMGTYFQGTMQDAGEQRESSGFLGSTGPLLTVDGENHNAFITISYWSDLGKLEHTAKSGVHLKAIKWWNENHAKYPHIGIMHETYSCPAGSYETVYHNFRPFGFAQTTYEVDNELGEKEVVDVELAREGAHLDSMYGRMGGHHAEKQVS